jgi:transposase
VRGWRGWPTLDSALSGSEGLVISDRLPGMRSGVIGAAIAREQHADEDEPDEASLRDGAPGRGVPQPARLPLRLPCTRMGGPTLKPGTPVRVLTQLPGAGPFTALVILAEIAAYRHAKAPQESRSCGPRS